MRKAIVLCIALALGLPAVASAQERKSPLAGAPAIRKRVELRQHRLELGAGLATTLGQDFYHAVMATGRLGFHLKDWLSIGGIAGFNISPNFETSFHEKLIAVLDTASMGNAPSRDQARNGMNKVGQMFALQAELTPFAGKLGLISTLFMNYDFYAFGGPGFVNFTSDGPQCQPKTKGSCPVVGLKVGANLGVGMHAFVNNFFAVNVELRDILLRNNPAGRDTTGDGFADSEDLSWDSNYVLSLNLMIFLPASAPVSP